jgi:uncharacterized membrane protein YoaK (UPF0700 family)
VFRREGFGRDARLNASIAAYLATIAGFVNSGGFLLVGTFTSHVTGNVGRLGVELASSNWTSAVVVLALVVSFFLGSFGASLVIEGSSERTQHAYGIALLIQGLLLTAFVWAAEAHDSFAGWVSARAALLCAAMGMQNSLVTRLSGAVVRTTHLTGVTTDLGIEAARWVRWHRERSGLPALFRGRSRPTRPHWQQVRLLLTIMMTFVSGALAGAVLTVRLRHWAILYPAFATLALSAYAFAQRDHASK